MTALHMGALHPFEQALTLVLAFGPFVLLGLRDLAPATPRSARLTV